MGRARVWGCRRPGWKPRWDEQRRGPIRPQLRGAPAWLMVAATFCAAVDAQAQHYPTKPIRLVVPDSPGGPNDTIGRIFAQRLAEGIGQQVIVDNRAGGGGNIGTEYVAKAAPDGYSLLSAGMGSTVINPLIGKVSYDRERDFAPR